MIRATLDASSYTNTAAEREQRGLVRLGDAVGFRIIMLNTCVFKMFTIFVVGYILLNYFKFPSAFEIFVRHILLSYETDLTCMKSYANGVCKCYAKDVSEHYAKDVSKR